MLVKFRERLEYIPVCIECNVEFERGVVLFGTLQAINISNVDAVGEVLLEDVDPDQDGTAFCEECFEKFLEDQPWRKQ